MKTMRKRLMAAQLLSAIFNPLYLPMLGLALLFLLSYLSLLPLLYKLEVAIIVYFFTILLPAMLIRLYMRYSGHGPIHLGQRERRALPYAISISCYAGCVYVFGLMHIPFFMTAIIMAALAVQIVCAMINVWWKISTHTAAVGGVAGALFCFAEFFSFNPVWWYCLLFIVAGLVGTSRMVLRQHTLGQVTGGFLIGIVSSVFAILFL